MFPKGRCLPCTRHCHRQCQRLYQRRRTTHYRHHIGKQQKKDDKDKNIIDEQPSKKQVTNNQYKNKSKDKNKDDESLNNLPSHQNSISKCQNNLQDNRPFTGKAKEYKIKTQ